MRVVTVTLIILIIFIVSAVMLDNYINDTTNDLLKDIEVLNKLIEENKWSESKSQLANLQYTWEDVEKRWKLFLEHYEMDGIDIAMSRLDQYIEIENKPLALGEMAELRLLVGHIKKKESFKLENIL